MIENPEKVNEIHVENDIYFNIKLDAHAYDGYRLLLDGRLWQYCNKVNNSGVNWLK